MPTSLPTLISLPAAVYSAIILFCVKEFLEWRRRRGADARKLSVYKRVLAHECERNYWLIKVLRDLASGGQQWETPYRITTEASGRQSWGFYDPNGTLARGGSLPKVKLDTIERLAVEVAYVDGLLAEKVREALDSVLELQHLRNSAVDYGNDQPGGHISAGDLQEGFFDYALSELEDHYKSLSKLYLACTGKELRQHRLR
ncbi:hypothetical protein [Rhizobium leguminosarum]|uniref:hypothetical protein n=1 Tax=Rhizobium leguminosarum TaxID=384 RepID=UPI0010408A0C|nr:hypothetical protein [Rhizobium leguminosarum]TCA02427.1 hypothetical protein E0H68_35905 [Rhizobium leguminosarum bv. viciae]TCA20293.1 hypothetical protein E0H67_25065 [Rhizobium leguminosarum bv. viciae]